MIDTAKERKKLAALAGHTPGPWAVNPALGMVVNLEGGEIAIDPGINHYFEADFTLIAAAPDLKTTLAAALDEIDRLRYTREAILREAIDACHQQSAVFGLPDYATGSFSERFACGACADAIQGLTDTPPSSPRQE